MKILSLIIFVVGLAGCGKKPDDKKNCGDGEIARGGECISKPQLIKCGDGEVRRGSQCLSPRESYCTNWANNYPECNQCPAGYSFELNRCRCADAACYNQAQCADPAEGAGRRLLIVNTLKENVISDLYGVNLNPSIAEIEENTGIEVVHRVVDNSSDFDSSVTAVNSEEWDAVWVIDGAVKEFDWDALGSAIRAKTEKGMGLAILADNEPYSENVEKALTVAKPAWTMKIAGDYKGEGAVSLEGYPSEGQGKLFEHEITTGLYQSVSEGVTISHVVSGAILTSPLFKVVLKNTEGNTGVAAVEEELTDQAAGYAKAARNLTDKVVQRTVVHTGFTSLYQHEDPKKFKWTWNAEASPGTPLLWFNMACWTTNVK